MNEENNTYEIHYDKVADFLEVFLGEPTNCNTKEIEEGVFVRRDNETNEVKSIGILSFKKRVQMFREILSRFNIELPLEISMR